MARTVGIESLELKIDKAKMDVVKTKEKYDKAVSKLSDLMDKADAIKRDELVKTMMKSSKSYEEILRFLTEEPSEEEQVAPQRKRTLYDDIMQGSISLVGKFQEVNNKSGDLLDCSK